MDEDSSTSNEDVHANDADSASNNAGLEYVGVDLSDYNADHDAKHANPIRGRSRSRSK